MVLETLMMLCVTEPAGVAVSKMPHVRQLHAIKMFYGVRQSHAQKIYGV